MRDRSLGYAFPAKLELKVANVGTAAFQELEQVDPVKAHLYRERCLWQLSIDMAVAIVHQVTEAEREDGAKIAAAVANLERMQIDMDKRREQLGYQGLFQKTQAEDSIE